MKKLLILLLVCIMLCSCSKSSETPVSDSQPTNTPTKEETADLTPTNAPSEYTIDGSCDICHKTKKLKEYRFEQKTYAVCEDCYNEKILGYEADNEVYNNLVAYIQVAMTDTANVNLITGNLIKVEFDGSGIHCDNDQLAKYLQETMEVDFSTKAKTGTYTITVRDIYVFAQDTPKHPLAE